jgi:WD40 repeat protein
MLLNKAKQYKGHRAAIYQILVVGNKLWSVGGDGFVVEWPIDSDGEDGRVLARVEAKVFAIAVVSPDMIVLGDLYGHLYWVDIAKGTTLRNVKGHQGAIYGITVVNDKVYTTSADGYLTRWSTSSMLPEESISISAEGLRKMIYTDHGLIIGTSSNEVVVLDLEAWQVTHRWPAHDNSVFSLAVVGDRLLSGGRDAHLRSWQMGSWQPDGDMEAHWFTINDLLVVDEHDLLISASRDKSIRLWDLHSMTPLLTKGLQQGGHVNSVNTLAYHNDKIYSAGDDRSIIAWDLVIL